MTWCTYALISSLTPPQPSVTFILHPIWSLAPAASGNLHFYLPSRRTPTAHLSPDFVRTPPTPPTPIGPRASTPRDQRPLPTGAWRPQSSGSVTHTPLLSLPPLTPPVAAPSWPALASTSTTRHCHNQTPLTVPTGEGEGNTTITQPINQRRPPQRLLIVADLFCSS